MRQPSALVEGRTRFVEVGPVRGIRVRACDTEPDADMLLGLAVVLAGLVGVVAGVAGSNASLVLGWLS